MLVLTPAASDTKCGDCCKSPNTWRVEIDAYGNNYGFCCDGITQLKTEYNEDRSRCVCLDDYKTEFVPASVEKCPKGWDFGDEDLNPVDVCFYKN